jgi:DNA-binding MarR family transcriptional regulator
MAEVTEDASARRPPRRRATGGTSRAEGQGRGAAGGPDPAAEAWRLLVQVFLSQRDRFLAVARSMGITPVHAHALKMLQAADGPSMRRLAQALQCDASNVTAIIDRLESRGYVERRPSPTDRRVKMLVLTRSGVAAAGRIERALFEPPPALQALDVGEVEALRRIAVHLTEGLPPTSLGTASVGTTRPAR